MLLSRCWRLSGRRGSKISVSRLHIGLPTLYDLKNYSEAEQDGRNLRDITPNIKLRGVSGQRYHFSNLGCFQTIRYPPMRLYEAYDEEHKLVYVEKSHPDNFPQLLEVYNKLAPRGTKLCLPFDAIPEDQAYVFPLSGFGLRGGKYGALAPAAKKKILWDVIQGLAQLHAEDFVHTSFGPHSITFTSQPDGEKVRAGKLHNLEHCLYIPPWIDWPVYKHARSWMWQSPEIVAGGPVTQASDIFGFGITIVWVLTGLNPILIRKNSLPPGICYRTTTFERLATLYSTPESFQGLFDWFDDGHPPEEGHLAVSGEGAQEERTWSARGLWKSLDPVTADLIRRLTNFDPRKRLTALQAMEHEFWDDVRALE
ncbi:kinase-like domain-containing protein [Aspergillus karnatakaensis]|uniref:kinase-like domain-containing protein n=1 Tax=Aspergillus karnatakaensis TaxID=1810916 RepID=UPI003CCE06FC